MANSDYAWLRYAELQQRSKKAQDFNDYTWGLESALNFLLNAIEAGTLPSNPADLDAAINRAVASGARLCRSRSAKRMGKSSSTPASDIPIERSPIGTRRRRVPSAPASPAYV